MNIMSLVSAVVDSLTNQQTVEYSLDDGDNKQCCVCEFELHRE